MKSKSCKYWITAVVGLAALALVGASQAQTVTNSCPNNVISWNQDYNGTIHPTDLAGLAPATNWDNTWPSGVTTALPDNSGNPTTLNIGWHSYNGYSIQGHPGYDANGTADRELLNGFLNNGFSTWETAGYNTNNTLYFTNIPYAKYDVIVYVSDDTSGRHYTVDDGNGQIFYGATMASSEVSGANALFQPATSTNSASFPQADFMVFRGETSPNLTITQTPKSGADQWVGIAGWQIIQESNTCVFYGPSPASHTISIGQPASFTVLAGGLNPAYQWRHAGTNIVNSTNATYAITSTVGGQDGNYDVVITNSFSSVTSVVATLTFYAPKTDTWAGTGSAWDFSSLDWTVNGGISTTNYADTDNIRFDPLGAAQPTVSLGGTITPGFIIVSNASYTFNSGSFAGPGSLHLMNNATFILDTADTRTGPTLIDNGSTLQLDNYDTAGTLGSGALTNNGALLFNAAGDEAYGYPVYGTGNITNLSSAGQITLANTLNANFLVQAGAGSLLLQGNNNLTGGLVVSSGTVEARASGCFGLAPVTVSGGELQLIFNIDFAGSTLNLAGGLLHGGMSGSDSYEGQVVLATDSTIQVDSLDSLTLANPAGVNGGNFNLTVSGGGMLILNGNSNSWNSLNISFGTVAFNSAANLIITSSISGGGNLSQTGSGSILFAGDLSGLTGLTTVSAGTMEGAFTDGGSMSVLPNATLAPGTPSNIGTMTINGVLTLGGNLLIKLNKSLVQSNDIVAVPGGVSNTNNGVVTVNNLGPALAVGDKFTLFSSAVTGGDMLAVSGGGVTWSNNLVNDGSIIVLSTTVPHPVIMSVGSTSSGIVFSGTNGIANGTYQVLSTTNLALPLSSWTQESAGTFDASGNFSATNTVSAGVPQKFYRLAIP
jgi:autotransporter-associated beta strand protein